jgi:hypothetical protein
MTKKICTAIASTLVLGISAQAQMSSDAIFEKLKSFEGEWEFVEGKQRGSCTKGEDANMPIEFKLIGKGTAIQEDLMPGSEYQMVTMYHQEDLNDKDIIGTHYCVKKNQPAFRADLKNSTPDKMIFKCDETRTKLCKGKEPYRGSYVDSIVYETDKSGILTVHYLGRGQKPNDNGYTRCKFKK